MARKNIFSNILLLIFHFLVKILLNRILCGNLYHTLEKSMEASDLIVG